MTAHMEGSPLPMLRTSERLRAEGFAHGFFTRVGGVSAPPWDTLSFTIAAGDEPEAVQENRARAAHALGVEAGRLYYASQVHGTACVVLDGSEDADEVVRRVADLTASRTSGVACGVRSADCVPILLADRHTGAVVAIHSGWRGTVLRASLAGLAVLAGLGARPSDVIAAIGPHLEGCCFEVGLDVAAALAACSGARTPVVRRDEALGKAWVDLRSIVRAQLVSGGVAREAIDDVAGCTVHEPALYHSFRRDGGASGRLLSAIVAR